MWIETEPGDLLMMRYLLCFPATPDPEDQRVRAFLREHGLSPKRRWSDERAGIRCEVLQFGQCYLGRALDAVVALQQRGMVAESVAFSLETDPDLAALVGQIDHGPTSDLAWTVAGLVLDRDGIRPAPDDPNRSIIDPLVLRDAVRSARATSDEVSSQAAARGLGSTGA
jgi:hypothetical protein